MNLHPLPAPLAGEKLVAVSPPLAPYVDSPDRAGRLNFFPGRHLTDDALQREQAIRVQRLLRRGQAATPGVVDGLEVSLLRLAGEPALEIAPGQALTPEGEDVVLHHSATVKLGDLQFFDPELGTLSLPIAQLPGLEAGDFAAVLVLQPGFVRDTDLPLALQIGGHGTDFSPCERIPEDEAFYRTTQVDAARFILCRWRTQPAPGAAWRNRLAWEIFRTEKLGHALPWTGNGVPLALVGFNTRRRLLWLDRHSVARPGGRPRQRVLHSQSGDPRLWEAQFGQFCTELSETGQPAAAVENFVRLPPVGVLLSTFLDLDKQPATNTRPETWLPQQSFFPTDWVVDVAVAPLEQLDALVAATRSLQPFDLRRRDAVRLILPVPQSFFDPDLLRIEEIDPRFEEAINRFKERRGDWLAARADSRARLSALHRLSTGQVVTFPEPDPQQLEPKEQPLGTPPEPATLFGVTRDGTDYTVDLLAKFSRDAEQSLRKFETPELDEIAALAKNTAMETDELQELEEFKQAQKRVQDREEEEWRMVLEDKKEGGGNLARFVASLEQRVDEADRLADAGFLKVRVDVTRLGHLLSNNSLGTQWVASPSLANILKRRTELTEPGASNLFASQLLANLAPSAIARDTGDAPAPRDVQPRAPGVALMHGFGDAGGGTGFQKFKLEEKVDMLSGFQDTLATPAAKNNLTTLEDFVSKSTELTKEQKDLFTGLKAANAAFDSQTLKEVAAVGKFAGSYVENFNALSQKQLRTIPLDRLQPPLAPKVREEIHHGRLEVFERLARLNISLAGLSTEFVDKPVHAPEDTTSKLGRLHFHALIVRRKFDMVARIDATSQQVVDADESKHFTSGVKFADMSQAALRAVEQRIQEYRDFLGRCREYLAELQAQEARLQEALRRTDDELQESRHDVSVAQALQQEEEMRLQRINNHRADVLREQVKFLVFHRPRAVFADQPAPVRKVEPAATEDPVPACLREELTLPAELAAFREVFRDSPAAWFLHAPKWLGAVDRWDQLRWLLRRAGGVRSVEDSSPLPIAGGRFKTALDKVLASRLDAARRFVSDGRPADLALDRLSWADMRREAEQRLTLGQLIDAGPTGLGRQAAGELDDLFKVAACLHQGFGRVPALVRLVWAERFSEFDGPADFRDLSRLPRWQQVEFTLRRELQTLADWLFGRIQSRLPAALELINDLVRVCLLLASHAPVDQIITGSVIESGETAPGSVLKIRVDPLRVRHGMLAVIQTAAGGIVRAVVEDITQEHVSARVLAGGTTGVRIGPSEAIRFSDNRG